MSTSYICRLVLCSFFLSLILCLASIPILKRLHAGQNILSYVKEHHTKNGTPTMGGVAFISAAFLTTFCFYFQKSSAFIVTSVIGLSYMIVGFLDDLLKKRHNQNLGLTALQKIIFQIFVAGFAAWYAFKNGLTVLNVPFFGVEFDVGWWIVPFAVFVFLATVNCVNLTDGLDGLASGVCLPFFLFFGALITVQKGDVGLSMIAFSLAAALLAYLIFNASPANVFMGDTGSLALGGIAAAVGVFSGNVLYIAIVGLCFVISGVSVILQVIYFKLTNGKRIFKMAPIHHHFQQMGYSESKISYAYFALTVVLSVMCFAFAI